jgi:hypothetical protein
LDFLKKNNVRCSKLVKNVEDRLFSFQVILNARSCILLNDISYIYHKDNDSSFTINEINGLASESVMNDYQNIIRTKYEDLQNYVDKDFYTQAILENYLLAMRFAKIIDSSTIIPQEVKRQTVQTFKALPAIEINKIPKIKNRLHLLSIICLNILPSISIKTFIIKAYDKILRTYFTGKL